jgi:hypothetical protein
MLVGEAVPVAGSQNGFLSRPLKQSRRVAHAPQKFSLFLQDFMHVLFLHWLGAQWAYERARSQSHSPPSIKDSP